MKDAMNTLRKRYEQAFPAHHMASVHRTVKSQSTIEPSLTKFAFQLERVRRRQTRPVVLAKPQR